VTSSPTVNYVHSSQTVAQLIIPSSNRLASDVSLFIRKDEVGSIGNCVLHFEDTSAEGVDIETISIAPGSIGTSYGLITFTFSQHRKLTAGRTYRIYLTNTGDSNNRYEVLVASAQNARAPYSSLTYGGASQTVQVGTPGSWSSKAQYDIYFRMKIYPISGFGWTVSSPQTNNELFVGTVRLTVLSSDAADHPTGVMTDFSAAADNLTVSANTGTISGLRGSGNAINDSADDASGIINLINDSPLQLTYTGTSGQVIITVTDGVEPSITASVTITVDPGAVDHFAVSFSSPQNVGTAFGGSNTITAQDFSNNTVTGFASDTTMTIQQNPAGYDISGLTGGGEDIVAGGELLKRGRDRHSHHPYLHRADRDLQC